MDEAIAAASEESESESTCSVRSRSSETLLLSEDEQVAHDKQDSSSLRPSLSPYFVSPETNVPIPWSCSDVLLDRPAALDLQDIEAMEEVQAMVTGQFEEYEQSTTIMSFDVHGKAHPCCFGFFLTSPKLCVCCLPASHWLAPFLLCDTDK